MPNNKRACISGYRVTTRFLPHHIRYKLSRNLCVRLLFLLFSFSLAFTASGQYFCVKEKPWSCLGSIEVSFSATEEAGLIRLHVYSNGESLAEASNAKSGESKLLILKPHMRMYAGVPDDEIKSGSAFVFFDYGFAYPLLALQKVFPNGFSTVPEKEIVTSIVLEKDQVVKITARRISKHRINYRLVMKEQTLSGFWDSEKKSPLSDNFNTEQWEDNELRAYTTLGEARAFR
jgi:hypothetical protein